jgi:beta-lactamase family protein
MAVNAGMLFRNDSAFSRHCQQNEAVPAGPSAETSAGRSACATRTNVSFEERNMGFRFARTLESCVAPTIVLSLIAFVLSGASPATTEDDNQNTAPTAWWILSGQSGNDVSNTIRAKNARIIDIKADDSSFNSFTVTYVQNTGAYAKQWWWYAGIDANTLERNLAANHARLISLKAYDTGGGNIRFVAVMIANTGADAKQWWWFYGKSPAEIANLIKANKARLTALQSYPANGQTHYAVIMIANTGADDKAWWWYTDERPQTIDNAISANKARLLDVTSAGNGNFNAVMEGCSGACPAWWWYYGLDGNATLAKAQDNGARILTADTYPGCGSRCFATVMIGNTPADITACDSQGCISEAKLAANICNTLANHVVGYSCLVGGMRPISGGLARTNANPPSLAMSSDLVTDIASVSKTMTAVAILQLLARNNLTIDTKISSYIYSDWKQGSNINQLTFKNLLTHTSGFAQLPGNACGNDITYSALKTIVAGGVQATNIGKPSYGNCNFALLRELMPALLGQPLNNVPDGSQRAQQSSTLYINYMNARVFRPVGVPAAQCKPPSGTNDILSYTNPAGSTSGTDWGDWSLQCGSGGWVLSADDIFKVVNDIADGHTLLSSAERKQMLGDCLGWDCAVRSDCPNPYACKNGDLNNGAGTAVWTYAGVLKCDVPVVVVVNSPLPSPYQNGGDIIGLVENALKGASVPGTPRSCP